eukprot:208325-Pelagomonas_calceolata.AAC.1
MASILEKPFSNMHKKLITNSAHVVGDHRVTVKSGATYGCITSEHFLSALAKRQVQQEGNMHLPPAVLLFTCFRYCFFLFCLPGVVRALVQQLRP